LTLAYFVGEMKYEIIVTYRGLDPQKPHFFEAASNQLPSSTVRLSVGLPRCFTSLTCFLNKPRSHTHPRSRDSVAMPPTIRANGSSPGTSMKQRNSRGGVYVASHLRRLAPRTSHPHHPFPHPILSILKNHIPALVGVIAQKRTSPNHHRSQTLLAIHQQDIPLINPPRGLCPHKPHHHACL
jgi:hypothetical protein